MRTIEVSAKTRKDAIQQALDKLGVELHEVSIEILDEGSRGIFGLGARDVKVRVRAEGLPDLPEKPAERPERPEHRGRRPEHSTRPERGPRPERAEQGARQSQPEQRRERRERQPQPQPERAERRERPAQSERRPSPERPARSGGERPAPADRPKREQHDRPERAQHTKREEQQRAERPPRAESPKPATVIDEATRLANERTGAEAAALLQEMIGLMGLESSVTSAAGIDGSICLTVQSPDSAILIGRKGRNLSAMQYLINRMALSGESSEAVERLTVDIEGYLDRRRANLEEMARRMAQKVKDTGKEVRLQPLNPQERRVVHLALQEDADVRTFSLGNAAFRSVVIAPKNAPQKSANDRQPASDRPRRSRGGSRRGGGRRQGHGGPNHGREGATAPSHGAGESVEGAVQDS